jgi:hypothetical protein
MPARTGSREEWPAAHGLAGYAIKQAGGDRSTIKEVTRDD